MINHITTDKDFSGNNTRRVFFIYTNEQLAENALIE
jgi:hypothetical protein